MRIPSWSIKKYPQLILESWLWKAFIIHGKHDVLAIYYAKFPNEYLQAIAKYGHRYKELNKLSITIILYRTQKFRMRRTDDRVKFFRFLARVGIVLPRKRESACWIPLWLRRKPNSHYCPPLLFFLLMNVDEKIYTSSEWWAGWVWTWNRLDADAG